ncbi:MAG TPA: glutathione S-transferase [Kofleriaceae bacterium]
MYELFITTKNYTTWALRPWLLMRERDIAFRERLVHFGTADFHTFSPSGRVPALHDGDVVVWESLAIVEYLAERHAGVWPSDPRARAWARSAASEMHAGFATLRSRCTNSCGLRIELRDVPDALAADIARIAAIWTEGLTRFGGPFLAGAELTAVDAFFAPVAFRAQTYSLPFTGVAADYVARLLARPAMREWYAAALAETEREPGHEADARATGRWIEDLRAH